MVSFCPINSAHTASFMSSYSKFDKVNFGHPQSRFIPVCAGVCHRSSAAFGAESMKYDNGTSTADVARDVLMTSADFLVQQAFKPEQSVWHQKMSLTVAWSRMRHDKWPRHAPPILRHEPVGNFSCWNVIICRADQSLWPLASIDLQPPSVTSDPYGGAGGLSF